MESISQGEAKSNAFMIERTDRTTVGRANAPRNVPVEARIDAMATVLGRSNDSSMS
jgi:hypothetical protein